MGVNAPWAAEQVDNLNRFQRVGWVHPFTCPGHDDAGSRELVATRSGWICCHCDYRQDWAHEHMCEFTAERAENMNPVRWIGPSQSHPA